MPPRRRLSDVDRGGAIALHQQGIAVREIARRFRVSHSVIQRLIERWRNTGTVRERQGRGRPRATTRQQDRLVRLSCLRDRTASAQTLRAELRNASNVDVSGQTIRNRLREAGLRSRRPAVRVPLTQNHRNHRMTWATLHRRWTLNQWSRVLFTDESRFTLRFNDGRIRVWRRPGERYVDATIREHDRYGGGSLMVWGGFSTHHRTPLHIVNGRLNGVAYRDTILRPLVLPALQAVGNGAIFMDDNARCSGHNLPTAAGGSTNELARPVPRPQPDRARLGCTGAASARHQPACSHPSGAGPAPATGVAGHPPSDSARPGGVHASSLYGRFECQRRSHAILNSARLILRYCDFSFWGYVSLRMRFKYNL